MYLSIIHADSCFDRLMDWHYGIDTSLTRPFTQEEIAGTTHGDPTKHMSTSYISLLRLRRLLKLTQDDVIVDLGCASGRAVLVFANGPARECRGIDFDDTAIELARRNARSLGTHATKIRFEKADATRIKLGDESVIYMFNPFGIDTLRSVMSNLRESLRERPRRLRLCYHNPVHREYLDTLSWLTPVDRLGGILNETVVYEAGDAKRSVEPQ